MNLIVALFVLLNPGGNEPLNADSRYDLSKAQSIPTTNAGFTLCDKNDNTLTITNQIAIGFVISKGI